MVSCFINTMASCLTNSVIPFDQHRIINPASLTLSHQRPLILRADEGSFMSGANFVRSIRAKWSTGGKKRQFGFKAQFLTLMPLFIKRRLLLATRYAVYRYFQCGTQPWAPFRYVRRGYSISRVALCPIENRASFFFVLRSVAHYSVAANVQQNQWGGGGDGVATSARVSKQKKKSKNDSKDDSKKWL